MGTDRPIVPPILHFDKDSVPPEALARLKAWGEQWRKFCEGQEEVQRTRANRAELERDQAMVAWRELVTANWKLKMEVASLQIALAETQASGGPK